MGAWVQTMQTSGGIRKVIGSDVGDYNRGMGLDDRNKRQCCTFLRYTAFAGDFGAIEVCDMRHVLWAVLCTVS